MERVDEQEGRTGARVHYSCVFCNPDVINPDYQ